jgi:hypothetical protein
MLHAWQLQTQKNYATMVNARTRREKHEILLSDHLVCLVTIAVDNMARAVIDDPR